MAGGNNRIGKRPPDVRSKVTNGSKLLTDVDGRSAPARRYRDLYQLITSDVGGADSISTARQELCRRAAGLAVLCEQIEADVVRQRSVDSEDYVRLINGLSRVLKLIGLKRLPKDITPSLAEAFGGGSD